MPKQSRKTLILVRHAKSSWSFPGLADEDRPLNARGRRDAPLMAEWLATTHYRPDLLLTSVANRALTTARIFAHALHYPIERIRLSEAVYEATAEQLLQVIAALDDADGTVMLFGHNPGFNDLLARLVGHEVDNVATAAVAIVNLSISRWSQLSRSRTGKARATLELLQLPKQLRCAVEQQQQKTQHKAATTLAGERASGADLPPTQRSDSA